MELLAFALTMLGLGLMLFAVGAICAWAWAVKSLSIGPPAWIVGVTAAAGTALIGGFLLRGNWFSALTSGVLWAMIVGAQLQVGPFHRSGGREAP
jgi:hypothetical protein